MVAQVQRVDLMRRGQRARHAAPVGRRAEQAVQDDQRWAAAGGLAGEFHCHGDELNGCAAFESSPVRRRPRQSAALSSVLRSASAASYSALRGAPVISTASLTAVLSGNSASSSLQHAHFVARFGRAPGLGAAPARIRRVIGWHRPVNQAGKSARSMVAISSNCLVNSRPIVSRSRPQGCQCSGQGLDAVRCLQHHHGAALAGQRLRFGLRALSRRDGRKPANTNPWSAEPEKSMPATLSAAVTLLGPGYRHNPHAGRPHSGDQARARVADGRGAGVAGVGHPLCPGAVAR